MANLGEQVLDSIEIIAQAVNQDKDVTIQATILSEINTEKGIYLIECAKGRWYATASSQDPRYKKGTAVMVLIPNGDYSGDKLIIGAVGGITKAAAPTYIPESDRFIGWGENYITVPGGIGLWSYYGAGDKTAYLRIYKNSNYTDDQLLIQASPTVRLDINDSLVLDYENLLEDINTARSFYVQSQIQTFLEKDQQNAGKYGIKIEVDLEDYAEDDTEAPHFFDFSSGQLSGNPLKFIIPDTYTWYKPNYTERKNANGELVLPKIAAIKAIYLYAKDFLLDEDYRMNTKGLGFDGQGDIVFSDFNIQPCTYLTEQELSSVNLYLKSSRTTFDVGYPQITVTAELKKNGKVQYLNDGSAFYYWFIEQPDVYDKNDRDENCPELAFREGWKFIGTNGNSNQFVYNKTDFKTQQRRIKCVVLVKQDDSGNTSAYEATLALRNKDNDYSVIDFIITETLSKPNAQSAWEDAKYRHTFSDLLETVYCKGYSTLESTEVTTKWFFKDSLLDYQQKSFYENDIIQITGNDVNTNRINSFYCCFYINNNFICFKEYSCAFVEGDNTRFDVTFHYGDKEEALYTYNDAGISPMETPNNVSPISIEPITFTFTDLEKDPTNHIESSDPMFQNTKWLVVAKNNDRLINLTNPVMNEDVPAVITYNGIDYNYAIGNSVNYTLKREYSTDAQSNQFKVLIQYQGMTIAATASIQCSKRGDPGMKNANEYCDIVPDNDLNGNSTYTYFNIMYPVSSSDGEATIDMLNAALIYKNTDVELTNKTNRVRFRLLKDNKWNNLSEVTEWSTINFPQKRNEVDPDLLNPLNVNNGVVSGGWGLLKGIATITDEETGLTTRYTRTIPIGYCTSRYISLVENSGFTYVKYSSAGTYPIYDNNRPFELRVVDELGNDITNDCIYNWQVNNIAYNLVASTRSKPKLTNIDLLRIVNEYIEPEEEGQSTIIIPPTGPTCSVRVNTKTDTDNILGYDLSQIYVACNVTRQIDDDVETIGRIVLPIYIYSLSDDNSQIADWDGRRLDVGTGDEDNPSYILANMVGAGKKNDKGQFTGMVMGTLSSNAYDTQKEQERKAVTGLVGFADGQQSFFLNAEDGSAEFGLKDKGTIAIRPGQDPVIISGQYEEKVDSDDPEKAKDGSGLKINFGTEPFIRYGNENFMVDKDGKVTMHGADIHGSLSAGDKDYFDKIVDGKVTEDAQKKDASYIKIQENGQFELGYARAQYVDGTYVKQKTDTYVDEDGNAEDVEYLETKEVDDEWGYTQSLITPNRIEYGFYAPTSEDESDTDLIKGIIISKQGDIRITGGLTADNVKITGKYSAGDYGKFKNILSQIKTGEFDDNNKSTSFVNMNDYGFKLEHVEQADLKGKKYYKEVPAKSPTTGQTYTTLKLTSIPEGITGYRKAEVSSNGFSFGTYAVNLGTRVDSNGSEKKTDVMVDGIKYSGGSLQISGKITAHSGSIGGWSIDEQSIKSPGGGLILWADGRISGYDGGTNSTGDSDIDTDWLDIRGRALLWKRKTTTSRVWDKEQNKFVNKDINITAAKLYSRNGNILMDTISGVSMTSMTPKSGGYSFKIPEGRVTIENCPQYKDSDSQTKDFSAPGLSLLSENNNILLRLGGITNEQYNNYRGLQSGAIGIYSNYADAVRLDGDLDQDKNTPGKKFLISCTRKKAVAVKDEEDQGEEVKNYTDQKGVTSWIVLVPSLDEKGNQKIDEKTGKKRYLPKENPTYQELINFYQISETFTAADVINQIKDMTKYKNCDIDVQFVPTPILSKILGIQPKEVCINFVNDNGEIIDIEGGAGTPEDSKVISEPGLEYYDGIDAQGKPVIVTAEKVVGCYHIQLTEKYPRRAIKALGDDPDKNDTLKWDIYIDDSKDVKLLVGPDGHFTNFKNFDILNELLNGSD